MARQLAGRLDSDARPPRRRFRRRSVRGRSRRSRPSVAATMVNSRPRSVGPASMIERDPPAEDFADMLGPGRADRAAGIGRRARQAACRSPSAAPASPDAPARGSRWWAGPAVTSAAIAGIVAKRQHERQRARPMLFRQLARSRVELADPLRRGQIRHMDDQRVEARPALGLVDARDRFAHWSRRRRGRRRSRSAPRRAGRQRSAAPLRRSPRHRTAISGWFAAMAARAIARVQPTARMSGHDLRLSGQRPALRSRSRRPHRRTVQVEPVRGGHSRLSMRSSKARRSSRAGEFAPLERRRRPARRRAGTTAR